MRTLHQMSVRTTSRRTVKLLKMTPPHVQVALACPCCVSEPCGNRDLLSYASHPAWHSDCLQHQRSFSLGLTGHWLSYWPVVPNGASVKFCSLVHVPLSVRPSMLDMNAALAASVTTAVLPLLLYERPDKMCTPSTYLCAPASQTTNPT